MSALIATDLDRTMIYSRTAMGEQQFATLPLRCVEIYRGEPLSYLTVGASELLSTLSAVAPVVPVTTRTPEQFGRIMLPGTTSSGRYAVVSSGGRILVDGADDVAWRAGIEDAVGHAPVSLDRVLAELHSRIADSTSGRPWVRSVRVADDLFCYLVADTDRQPPTFLPAWQSWCADREWVVSQQGRKIYALPRAVTKSAAVAEVRRRLVADGTLHPDDPVYAAGDGRLDIDLLEYADHAIRPRHGELDEIDYRRNHLTITESVGVLAGEEILRWFGARTTTATPRPIPTTVRTPS